MNALYSLAMASCTKVSIAIKPLGDKSVFEEILSKNDITVSPILIVFIEAIKSIDFFDGSLLALTSAKCFARSFCNKLKG